MIWDFFKKKPSEENELDVLKDLTLSKMGPGYLVDYDMKTFKVSGRNYYRWHEGEQTQEWELKCGEEALFLECEEEDGEEEWTLTQKFPIGALEGDIAQHIIENEDPPNQVVYDGKTFYLVSDDIGEYFKGQSNEGLKFVVWDYSDDRQETCLSIEQWGETKFDVTVGREVEEYQFSNILPGKL